MEKIKYEDNHKEIDGVLYKRCSIHNQYFPNDDDWFPCTDEYFYKKKSSKRDGVSTYCKICEKKKNTKWQQDNPERIKIHNEKEYKKPHVRKYLAELSKARVKNGKRKKWEQDNPDKIKQYRLYRELHKTHVITKQEWISCKKYFNNCCAYCGLPLKEHYNMFSREMKWTDFHKEHVNHEGSNDLSNCIPSCKVCNSSKHTRSLESWYNKNNPNFNQNRLDKIYKWLDEDYKLYIVIEQNINNEGEIKMAIENKRGVILTINDKQYRVWVSYGVTEKIKNEKYGMNTILRTHIYNITDEKMLTWKEIKDTYIEEKVSDYIENSFNGQESIYWNCDWDGRKQ